MHTQFNVCINMLLFNSGGAFTGVKSYLLSAAPHLCLTYCMRRLTVFFFGAKNFSSASNWLYLLQEKYDFRRFFSLNLTLQHLYVRCRMYKINIEYMYVYTYIYFFHNATDLIFKRIALMPILWFFSKKEDMVLLQNVSLQLKVFEIFCWKIARLHDSH